MKIKTVNPLPSWAVGVISVASMAAIAFVGYKIYSKLKSEADTKKNKEVAKDAKSDYNKLKSQGQGLSFPASTYSGVSNTIKNLLDGCELGASEIKAVESIAKVVKKPIDWFYLVDTFGVRKIDNCGWATGDTEYDLISLLQEQLDGLLFGDSVLGKRRFGVNTYSVLSDYLKTIGVNL
jgi:hypothetical protein